MAYANCNVYRTWITHLLTGNLKRNPVICNTDAEEKLNGYATYWQHKFKIESCIAYL